MVTLPMDIITPLDPSYNSARQMWNRAIQKYPAIIAYCKTIDDVKKAVLTARNKQLEIRIRSGGHNYEGYSIANKAYIIDVSLMHKIEINEREGTVTAEAGTNNSQMYNFLSAKGYIFPGGTCPTVSLSGYSLGGGWGYSARYLGLGCDNLVEIKLVDFNGQLITANEASHSDLFWACRGAGGGNFGVIVSFKFKLPPKIQNVTLFEMIFFSPSKDTQVQFLDTWQNWIPSAPRKINMSGGLYNTLADGSYMYGRGLFYGTPRELDQLLLPFSKIQGYNLSAQYLPFLQAVNIIAASYPPYEYFKSGGRFVCRKYTNSELMQLVNRINEKRPKGSLLTALNIYGLGGKVSDVAPSATAFYYRCSPYILSVQSVFENNLYRLENMFWVNKTYDFIYSLTVGSYINFPFYPLKHYLEAYYGKNVSRLQCIKCEYDPLNIFQFQQSLC